MLTVLPLALGAAGGATLGATPATAVPPSPQPQLGSVAAAYEIELLRPIGGGVAAGALGVNDAGDVVGITRPTGSAQPQQTVLWERHDDHFHAHGLANLPGSQFSRGFDVNDDLEIVGEAFNSGGGSIPIRWDGDSDPVHVTTLNEAGTGILNDISDTGVAVGTASGKALRVSAAGTVTTLPAPALEGATLNSYSASSIAEGGVVGGRASLTGASGTALHGVVWDLSGPRLLTTPDSGTSPAVANVTPDGLAVGSATVASKQTAVLWGEDGTPHPLALPSVADYTHTAALAMGAGVVVGYVAKFAGNFSFGGAAVAWDASGPVDLNSRVVDLPPGVTLQAAADVNAAGQIVGTAETAGGKRGFVLSPLGDGLHVTGLAAHYHSSEPITLSALLLPEDDAPATYRWSVRRADQSAFQVVTGQDTATLTLTAEPALHGALVRVERLQDGVVTHTSETVEVEVDDHGAEPAQTVSISGTTDYDEGDPASLTSSVTPATVLQDFQWYLAPAGSSTPEPIAGVTTAEYEFTATPELDGAEVTVAVTGEDGSVVYGPSDPVTLSVSTAPEPLATSISARAVSQVYGRTARLEVTVAPQASGEVTVQAGTRTVTGQLSAGRATVELPARALEPGTRVVQLSYAGVAGQYAPSSGTATVRVRKAKPQVTVRALTPSVPRGGEARVRVEVDAEGVTPSGKVVVTIAGRTRVVELDRRGRAIARITVPTRTPPGPTTVRVAYRGDRLVARDRRTTAEVRVTR